MLKKYRIKESLNHGEGNPPRGACSPSMGIVPLDATKLTDVVAKKLLEEGCPFIEVVPAKTESTVKAISKDQSK
ncbi:hypothetical protein HME7025_00087 [Aquirufa nivalisilvae]|uniref:Uncharacterized protein n=1 Tax=Aquirufa nivalisilvae TaxID=2516557 RepID=A0A2S2DRN4_9BACT|nr:hypothetical protein [Aquirufa nivalisilvae]AWL07972.1 hypothetical protein HME7025_00087 [Aquirufa nivalisilvae]